MFFVNGATYSSWTPRLPELQSELAIPTAALGLTLLGMGLGGFAASGFSGWLVDRHGSRTMTVTTSAAMSLWLPILGFAPTAFAVFAALIVLGALDGLTDVAMNSQAVELQRRTPGSIITRFHALWSAGAVVGGLVASRTAAAGISLHVQLAVTGVLLAVITLAARRSLLPDRRGLHRPSDAGDEVLVTRGAVLVALFLVGVAIALAELPPNEWAALLMSDRFDVSAGRAGLGVVAVAGGMLVGRVVGDRVTDGLGVGAHPTRPARRSPHAASCSPPTLPRSGRAPGSACSSPASDSRRCSRWCSARRATSATAPTAGWRRSPPVPGSASSSPRR